MRTLGHLLICVRCQLGELHAELGRTVCLRVFGDRVLRLHLRAHQMDEAHYRVQSRVRAHVLLRVELVLPAREAVVAPGLLVQLALQRCLRTSTSRAERGTARLQSSARRRARACSPVR